MRPRNPTALLSACGVLAAIPALGLLPGCAVTRIDVDVYKGPLVDEETIQAERLAVMVLGAKPLLAESRNLLEQRARRAGKVPEELRRPSTYAAAAPRDYAFESVGARRVNDVLSMFDDREKSRSEVEIDRGLQLASRYAGLWRVFRPPPDDPLWAERAELTRWLVDTGARPDPETLHNDAQAEVRDLVWEMLQPRKDAQGRYVFYERELAGRLAPGARRPDTDAAFRVLSEPAAAEELARRVLRTDTPPEVRGRFAAEVNRVAAAFPTLRTTLDQLLGTVLEVLSDLEPVGAAESTGAEGALTSLLSEYAAGLIQHRTLADALRQPDGPAQAADGQGLLQLVPDLAAFAEPEADDPAARVALARALARDPRRVAPALLAVHRALKSNGSNPHGLARGPLIDASRFEVGADVQLAVLQQAARMAGAFDRGRLDVGLHSLIEGYLDEVHNPRPGADRGEERFRQLSDDLVRFAQKVLFLANNQVILLAESDPVIEANARTLQAVGNAIIVQANELRHAETQRGRGHGRAGMERLAAVGVPTFPGEAIDRLLGAARGELDGLERREGELAAAVARLRAELSTDTARAAELQGRHAAAGWSDDELERQRSASVALADRRAAEAARLDRDADGKPASDSKPLRDAAAAKRDEAAAARAEAGDLAELAAARSRTAAAQEGIARAAASQAEIGRAKPRLEAAEKVLTGFRAAPPLPDASFPSANAAVGALIAHAETKAAAAGAPAGSAPGATTPEEWKHAAAWLATATLAEPLTAEESSAAGKDPTGVLDLEIAKLERRYRDEVALAGKGSESARRLRDAIDAAERYRSQLVSLRSPAAFLKSSYPVTSLQADQTAWDNMLGSHALRSVPFLNRDVVNGNARDLRTVSEIDKQHWQNINSVRVAGGGNTNYVMVKDDIGNWYVKNFSGDPEPVIRTARALALFSAGPALSGVDLLARDRRRQARADGSPAPAEQPDLVAFDRLVGPFQDRYHQAVRADARSLGEALATLDADVRAAIDATDLQSDEKARVKAVLDAATSKAALKRAREAADRAALETTAPTAAGSGLASALRDLNRVRLALLREIDALPAPSRSDLDQAVRSAETALAAEATARRQLTGAEVALEAAGAELDTAARAYAASKSQADADRVAAAAGARDRLEADRAAAETALGTAAATARAASAAAAASRADFGARLSARDAARAKVRTGVGDLVAAYLERRTKSSAGYEASLEVILQATTGDAVTDSR